MLNNDYKNNKEKVINFRATEEVLSKLKYVLTKYELKQSELLRYLIENEYDKIKAFAEFEEENKEDK